MNEPENKYAERLRKMLKEKAPSMWPMMMADLTLACRLERSPDRGLCKHNQVPNECPYE